MAVYSLTESGDEQLEDILTGHGIREVTHLQADILYNLAYHNDPRTPEEISWDTKHPPTIVGEALNSLMRKGYIVAGEGR